MESQPQNPEFRINPENFHPGIHMGQFMRLLYLSNMNKASFTC